MHPLLLPRTAAAVEPLQACRRYLDARWEGARWARRLLPGGLRDDLTALCAWFELVRELTFPTDEATLAAVLLALNGALEEAYAHEPRCVIACALREPVRAHGLPRERIGAALDARGARGRAATFETRDALLREALALVRPEARALLAVAGLHGERVELLADALGEGLVLTAWLDGFAANLASGRLLIAVEDLERAGLPIQALGDGRDDARTRALARDQMRWARACLAKGWPLCCELGPWTGRLLALLLRWHAARLAAREEAGANLFAPPVAGGRARLLACAVASLCSRRPPRFP